MEIYAVKILDISEDKLNELCLLIDSEKKYRVEKFINKKDKIRTLIGEILIRTIIFEKFKIGNEYIRFNKNQYGKPYLKDYRNFNFNISHSGEYVLCAVDNKPIGIDVEKVKYIEYKEISKNFFTTKEFNHITNQDLKFQLDGFYEMWTLKESYIKCCGQGLSMPLNSFCIELDEYKNIKVVSNNRYKEHTFKIFNIELGYKVAVCSLNREICNNITSLNHNSLIDKYLGISIG
ncbi:4'-phosphopantetheinyl transferase family protein [Bacillus thuringiensis]|uniref:4'-phosphopantetheinyl transferase family protein n=1 Tax=Bacillus thuringiensis TaxID=1428 RepID=UPI000BF767D0|nr:4'-phosphopantetheinyl transferase superfamily protein [Bacillus thuringiensis]PFJ51519.1 4-phosphopantetheinyl transferase [Bacillus thuringiensis]PFR39105.1 4-phosphopantetheinyl transferase [Bacillus thuringiensis]PGL28068.1 4-phosphopantetheinyl transferase [Bacillus thuringiensis]